MLGGGARDTRRRRPRQANGLPSPFSAPTPWSWLVYDRDIVDRRTDLEVERVSIAIRRRCREFAPPAPGCLWLDRRLEPAAAVPCSRHLFSRVVSKQRIFCVARHYIRMYVTLRIHQRQLRC